MGGFSRSNGTFKLVSMWFEASLELRINLEKSFIFPIGSFVNIESLVLELGCKVEVLPFF